MLRRHFIRIASLAAALPMLPISFRTAHAHEYRVGALEITHPWTRATPPGASTAVGYLVVENSSSEADRLIDASADFAGSAMLHMMEIDGDVMRMRHADGGLEIPAGGSLVLEPNGAHVMFMELKRPLVEGERAFGTLVFEKAGKIDIEWVVEALGASGHEGH